MNSRERALTRRPIQSGIRDLRSDEPDPERQRLREALSRWPSGVAVVAARDASGLHGVTVTSFSGVSLEPPLILVCLHQDAPVSAVIEAAGRFTVNLLGRDQKRIANIFSDRFPAAAVSFAEGDPVLDGSPVSLVCGLAALHDGGDHRIVLGRVERTLLTRDAEPLVYVRREYRGLDG